MPQYILAQESRMANIPDKLWYAMEQSDLAQIAANESVSLGDKVYVLKQGKMYMYGADSRWYDMGAGNSGGDVSVEPLEVTSNGTYTAEEGTAYSPVTVDVPAVEPTLTSKYIVENGTYSAFDDNADGYSEVDVNVAPNLTTEIISTNGVYTPGPPFDGYSSVDVNVIPATESLTATENRDYYPSPGFDGFDHVTVDVPPATLISKTITENGTYDAMSDQAEGFSDVIVEVPQQTLGTKSITSNGTYSASSDSLDGYSSVTVNVSGATVTQFASEGTIASPTDTITAGNMLAMAFAIHKYLDLTFAFGGNSYTIPCKINPDEGTVTAGLSAVYNGVATFGYIKWNVQNLNLVYDSLFFAQVNTDGTGFVDLSSMLPTSTAATINGYYWN